MKTDVLLVTVTPGETKAMLAAISEVNGIKPTPLKPGKRVYHNLGEINGVRVLLTQCEMGAGGLGGAQQAVQQSIQEVSPEFVIMVGIAFGVNEKKQNIGDILVSQQLCLYELQRVGKDEIKPRGDKPHACNCSGLV